jgi:hypothetical protein
MPKRTRSKKKSSLPNEQADVPPRRAQQDDEEEVITRCIAVPEIAIRRSVLHNLMDVDFLAERLEEEGLLYILSLPELCAALRKRLEEPNRFIWNALREFVKRRRPKLKRGPRPGKDGKYKKDRAKELLKPGKSQGDVGEEMYPDVPRHRASRRVSALLSLTKSRAEVVGMLGEFPIYQAKQRTSRKPQRFRRSPGK